MVLPVRQILLFLTQSLWLQLLHDYGQEWTTSKTLSLETLSHLLGRPPVVKVAQSCPTLCDPMDYTVHGILQARILEWVAFPFSRESSQPTDGTQVSCIAGEFFTSWATREAQEYWGG